MYGEESLHFNLCFIFLGMYYYALYTISSDFSSRAHNPNAE